MEKYKHLQERGNHNLLTISVKDSTAQAVDGALEYLCVALGISRSQAVREAIVESAVEHGYEPNKSVA